MYLVMYLVMCVELARCSLVCVWGQTKTDEKSDFAYRVYAAAQLLDSAAAKQQSSQLNHSNVDSAAVVFVATHSVGA